MLSSIIFISGSRNFSDAPALVPSAASTHVATRSWVRARGRISREDGCTEFVCFERSAPCLRKYARRGDGSRIRGFNRNLSLSYIIHIYALLLFALGHAVLGRLEQGGACDGVVVWRIAF